MFVKNTPLHVVFSTLFSVFHLVMKHCISCLIYYLYTFLPAKCHAQTSITLLIMPVLQLLMPGINVWVIAALTVSFWKTYQLYKETATNKRTERSMWMIDFLRILALISKRKVTGDEVVFLCVSVLIICVRQTYSGHLRNIFGNLCKVIGDLRILSDPYKNPGTLWIKMQCL